jgi:hypothetical protein
MKEHKLSITKVILFLSISFKQINFGKTATVLKYKIRFPFLKILRRIISRLIFMNTECLILLHILKVRFFLFFINFEWLEFELKFGTKFRGKNFSKRENTNKMSKHLKVIEKKKKKQKRFDE